MQKKMYNAGRNSSTKIESAIKELSLQTPQKVFGFRENSPKTVGPN